MGDRLSPRPLKRAIPAKSPLLVAAVPDCVGSNSDEDHDEYEEEQENNGNGDKHYCRCFATAQSVNGHNREDLQHNQVDVDSQGDESASNRYQADQGSEDTKWYLKQQRGVALLEECSLTPERFGDSVKDAHSNEKEDWNDDNIGKGEAAQEGRKSTRVDAGSCGGIQLT